MKCYCYMQVIILYSDAIDNANYKPYEYMQVILLSSDASDNANY